MLRMGESLCWLVPPCRVLWAHFLSPPQSQRLPMLLLGARFSSSCLNLNDSSSSFAIPPLEVDFGDDCRVERRSAGKVGYCNYALAAIAGMREVRPLAQIRECNTQTAKRARKQNIGGTFTCKEIAEKCVCSLKEESATLKTHGETGKTTLAWQHTHLHRGRREVRLLAERKNATLKKA